MVVQMLAQAEGGELKGVGTLVILVAALLIITAGMGRKKK